MRQSLPPQAVTRLTRSTTVMPSGAIELCGSSPMTRATSRGFSEVIGVPSNDFNQESADNATIREFCDAQFGIEFPMAALSHVRGDQAVPLFRWLATAGGGEPRWNFHKYLVGRDGRTVRGFATRVEPESPEMQGAIEAALARPAA